METVSTCFTTDGNGSYHGLAPWFFEEMTRFRRLCTSALLRLFTSARSRLLFHGSGSCHAPALSYFEQMTRCQRQKLHWRWPGNPNGWSKFRNLGLFTFTRSQLTLRWRLRGWWRFLEIAQTARNRRQKHRRDDQDRLKFCKYENICLRDQTKRLKNFYLLLRTTPRLTALCTAYFPAIIHNGFCFHIRKMISRRPWPHRKTEIYIL